jgi:four helix bundle protein
MAMVLRVYEATEQFPKREIFSLTDQIRRAAVSVPSNIAEGQAHFHTREFIRFLRHSRGSLAELETQILIAKGLKYLPESQAEQLLNDAAEVRPHIEWPDQLIGSKKLISQLATVNSRPQLGTRKDCPADPWLSFAPVNSRSQLGTRNC